MGRSCLNAARLAIAFSSVARAAQPSDNLSSFEELANADLIPAEKQGQYLVARINKRTWGR
jgi:hypothetical protein